MPFKETLKNFRKIIGFKGSQIARGIKEKIVTP